LAMYGLIGHQKFCSSITGSTKTNRPNHLVWKIWHFSYAGLQIY
jgi:hypothetical protein